MSGLLERIDELWTGKRVVADCPRCGRGMDWWISDRGDWGITCDDRDCDFAINLDAHPPSILCSVCGDILQKSGNGDTVFRCQGCGRTVTP